MKPLTLDQARELLRTLEWAEKLAREALARQRYRRRRRAANSPHAAAVTQT